MTTFFTSDEHYGHANIIGYCNRPFEGVEHQTEELIRRHNAVVQPTDTVWHLGDFCWKEKLVPEVLKRLNGMHCLVVGNHDLCHPMHRKHEAARWRYHDAGFLMITEWHSWRGAVPYLLHQMPYTAGDRHDTIYAAVPYLLHHMPYTADDRHDTKYAEWRPKNEGNWLLHGHVHDAWKIRDRMINVGVDVWGYAPVSLAEIEALRRSRRLRSTWE